MGPTIFFSPSAEERRFQVEQSMTTEQITKAHKRAIQFASKYMTEEEALEAMAESEKFAQDFEEEDAS
jgi:hypothetical protein